MTIVLIKIIYYIRNLKLTMRLISMTKKKKITSTTLYLIPSSTMNIN